MLPPLAPMITDDETLAETAFARLRHDIIAGVRPPGERLRIAKLKALYGIGPTPLREALQKLSRDGLVIAEGNRGFTVAPLDPAEFADLNLARTVIEKEALRLSVARGDAEWEARIVATRHILQKEDAALAHCTDAVPDTWEQANAAFHNALVSACGSSWLLTVRAQLHDLCERYRRVAVYQRLGARDIGAEHAAIAEAALARDADRCAALIEQHFGRTVAALTDSAAPRLRQAG